VRVAGGERCHAGLPVALRQLIDHGLAAKDAGTINLYFFGFLAAAVVFGGSQRYVSIW